MREAVHLPEAALLATWVLTDTKLFPSLNYTLLVTEQIQTAQNTSAPSLTHPRQLGLESPTHPGIRVAGSHTSPNYSARVTDSSGAA